MKRLLSLLLALLCIISVFALSSCGDKENGDEKPEETKKDVSVKEMADAVMSVLSYDGKIAETIYKENDADELVLYLYYLSDASCTDKVKDYMFTSPTDYCQTLAIFELDETATDDDFDEIKSVVTEGYIASRRSALQMYMPEQYEFMKWAYENPDAVWRQYGDKLVLCVYDGEEPTPAWEALDKLCK